jgi:hypothetical protein
MIDPKNLPPVGTEVWVKGVVESHDTIDLQCPIHVRMGYELAWPPSENIHLAPPTQEARKPWDVLREAAVILRCTGWDDTATDIEGAATRIEQAANPPNPVEMLRQVLDWHTENTSTLPIPMMNAARAAIAIHDNKKDTSND